MRKSPFAAFAWLSCLLLFVALAGCGKKQLYRDETFKSDTPFSAKVKGSGEVICWSVKRAFLTQGYMLERSSDTIIMTGTEDSQPDEETNITLRMQATCVDNRDGTSTIFASATEEVSKLQSVKQSVSAGVSIATVTVPSGSEHVMRVVRRETIHDADFYQRFYALVRSYAQEEASTAR